MATFRRLISCDVNQPDFYLWEEASVSAVYLHHPHILCTSATTTMFGLLSNC